MTDPFSEVISMLRPQAPYSKLASASGPFRVRRENVNDAFYCMLLSGKACLEVNGKAPLVLGAGDFVLIPEATSFTFSSLDPPPPPDLLSWPVQGDDGIYRIGSLEGPAQVQQLIGYCHFAGSDAELLISLLPDLIVVRGEVRLATLAGMVQDETCSDRPARDVVVERLLQVLLIEAFRSDSQVDATSGLLRGLADERIGKALRAIHAAPDYAWTVVELASKASLSRSAFFTRFNRLVGIAPMGYLLSWRMTLAKHLLLSGQHGINEISGRVGYGSASAFSTAFTRYIGHPPGSYKAMTNARI